MPTYLFAPVLRRLTTANLDSRAVEEACDKLGLDEDDIYHALISEDCEGECTAIKQEVLRIAKRIVDDCKYVNVGNLLKATVPIKDLDDETEVGKGKDSFVIFILMVSKS